MVWYSMFRPCWVHVWTKLSFTLALTLKFSRLRQPTHIYITIECPVFGPLLGHVCIMFGPYLAYLYFQSPRALKCSTWSVGHNQGFSYIVPCWSHVLYSFTYELSNDHKVLWLSQFDLSDVSTECITFRPKLGHYFTQMGPCLVYPTFILTRALIKVSTLSQCCVRGSSFTTKLAKKLNYLLQV